MIMFCLSLPADFADTYGAEYLFEVIGPFKSIETAFMWAKTNLPEGNYKIEVLSIFVPSV